MMCFITNLLGSSSTSCNERTMDGATDFDRNKYESETSFHFFFFTIYVDNYERVRRKGGEYLQYCLLLQGSKTSPKKNYDAKVI